MRIVTSFATGVLCLALGVSALWAGSTGKISGVVRDSRTNEPLPGVNVVVQGTVSVRLLMSAGGTSYSISPQAAAKFWHPSSATAVSR